MLKIFEANFEKSTTYKDKICLLQSATNLQLLCSPNEDLLNKILVKIKLFLEDGDSRFDGLLLLHTVLSQCSKQVFQENVLVWTQSILQVIQGIDGNNSKELACSIMKNIVVNLNHFPDLKKEMGDKLLSKIVAALVKTLPEDQWVTSVIDCLASLMMEMPRYMVPFKNEIQKFLANQLDCSLSSDVEPLAECYRHLPSIGERSINPASYSQYWSELIGKMLGSLNKILNFVYDGVVEELNPSCFLTSLELPEEPEDYMSALLCDSRRFQTISRCLAKLLCSKTNFSVKTPVTLFLRIIDQSLSVTFQKLAESKKSRLQLGSILPVIHSSALIILESLIISCPDHLIVQDAAIGKLLFRNLQVQVMRYENRTEEIECSMLRSTTYRVMRVWVENLRPVSLKHFANELSSEITHDISPDAQQSLANGMPTPNCLRQETSCTNGQSKALAKTSSCLEALQLLSTLLHSTVEFVIPKSLEKMQNSIIHIIFSVQQNDIIGIPYSDEHCRLELYRVYLRTVIHCQSLKSTSLHSAIGLFRIGQNDANREISRFCGEAFAICVKFIHPERVIQISEEAASEDSTGAQSASRQPTTSVNIVKVTSTASIAEIDTSDSLPGNPSQMNQSSAEAIARPSLPIPYSSGRNDSHPADNVMPPKKESVEADSKKDTECVYFEEDIDDIEGIEEEEDEEDENDDEENDDEENEEGNEDENEDIEEKEYNDFEEEEEAEEVDEEFPDINDMDAEASTPSEDIVNSKNDSGQEDNAVSNSNGISRAIRENGFGSSADESGDDVPNPSRKRKRISDEATGECPSPSKIGPGAEVQEKSEQEEAELGVEKMLQDFVASSPDRHMSC